ncbi:DnaJ domain-containing protein [Anabaena sphaerica FACHB-251]|uniref:DnaJ domain-containing protein n=1 Tax=Anabaena sphaerica FACHB-251 TaxID=2692883 RepID=A0A926WFF7_9NOST|nr:DnaJ domain-containing protein [Anabaena sphaerica]MBD2293508.1 DnaJ domain-containing protein [Anabaena sphaerica FACHB-251]
MSQNSLPSEILDLLVDPYAVLGVSVNADERQILKRYHALAKLLHPDNYINIDKPDKELAGVILTRLINPAYQELKQEKKRNNVVGMLRSKASGLNNQAVLSLQNALNLDIMSISAQEAELFYEKATASYASAQYKSLTQFHHVTKRMSKLNLLYLSLQKNDLFETQTLTDESTSIVPVPEVPVTELKLSEENNSQSTLINYAQRHYERAVQYHQQAQWALAVKELRDAIKLEPNNSDHYALLGIVHFQQNFPGMAKVYIRQALKLNPKHPLALKYVEKLKIQHNENSHPKSMAKALGIAALLGRFLSGKD